MSNDRFKEWLNESLNNKELDASVYSEYIISLLDETDDQGLCIWLSEIYEDPHDHVEFSKDIIKYFKHPELIPAMVSGQEDEQIHQTEECESEGHCTVSVSGQGEDQIHQTEECDSEGHCTVSVSGQDEDQIHQTVQYESENHCIEEDLYTEEPTKENGDIYDDNFEDYDEWNDMGFELDYVNLAMSLEELMESIHPSIVYSADAVFTALELGQWDLSVAAAALQCSADKALGTPSCRPCRHLVQTGQCLRADCAFDHSFASTPCRFWLTAGGGCTQGDCCPFLHSLCFPTQMESEEGDQKTAPDRVFTLDTSAFPSLGNNSGERHGERISVTESYKTVLSMSSNQTSEPLESSIRNNRTKSRVVRREVTPAIYKWVESGCSVAMDYQCYREEARTLAVARNKLLEQATQAYLGGSKSIAKNLSAEGRELNRRMKQCHQQAAMAIFRNRNTETSVFNHRRLDLHGLHVGEVRECLTALLPMIRDHWSGHRGILAVAVITGSGHHSGGPQKGRPRILYAAEELCLELGYKYEHIKDPRGYVGGLTVYIES